MFNEPKPFASLGPTLLARKGGAKPAMRPQLSPLLNGAAASADFGSDLEDLEDLGWNDMGGEDAPTTTTSLTPLESDPLDLDAFEAEDEADLEDDTVYGSLLPSASYEAKSEGGDEEYAAEDVPAEAPVSLAEADLRTEEPVAEPEVRRQQQALSATLRDEPARARRKANDDGRRAAFTLRLDAQRHLKLRLASTVRNRSAQQLVTQALDQFLAGIPEIDALAAQVKRA